MVKHDHLENVEKDPSPNEPGRTLAASRWAGEDERAAVILRSILRQLSLDVHSRHVDLHAILDECFVKGSLFEQRRFRRRDAYSTRSDVFGELGLAGGRGAPRRRACPQRLGTTGGARTLMCAAEAC